MYVGFGGQSELAGICGHNLPVNLTDSLLFCYQKSQRRTLVMLYYLQFRSLPTARKWWRVKPELYALAD